MVSQERAAVKRAAATEYPAEPSAGSVRKKQVAPPKPSSPGKNLAELAVSAKGLAKTSTGSARKMQFTQERAATKKVPLNANGSVATLTIGVGLTPK